MYLTRTLGKNGLSVNWSKFGDIPVHGDSLVGKADGNIRFYFENVDGFVVPTNKNTKKTKNNNNKQTYLSNLFFQIGSRYLQWRRNQTTI